MRQALYARPLNSCQRAHGRVIAVTLVRLATHENNSQEATAMIKKVKGGYKVLSSKGRNMGGPYKTREEALKRLRQVEFFKRQKG
ncbi:MAG: hypothetical protein WAM91_02665 [Candidatus Acidiferrales bacterium]